MNKLNIYISLLILLLFSVSCEKDKYEFGDIIAPSNVGFTIEIVGQDEDNPNGDGSGVVNLVATADNEINYRFDFGDGKSTMSPSGSTSHMYTDTGLNTYHIIVSAIGTGGVMSSVVETVEIYVSFSDVEAENYLAGANVGDSKTWYWAANLPLHVGLGPVEDDYGNGEFAWEAWWNGIQPFDEEKYCMYEDQFVFSRTADGITFEQTQGPAFVPGTHAGTIGLDGDTCHEDAAIPVDIYGVKNVSFFPSGSKAALEGSYNGEPYRQTSFEISDGGFMGWFVGTSTYDIIYITETEMRVRFIEEGDDYAWYALFQTQDPFEVNNFPDLVWSDEFDTDGAPDSSKWTYDLGAGGWGNNEEQTYTDDTENVIIEDGVLKITAIKEGDDYTSARLKTQGLFDFKYGRVEVKAKLPAAQGTWPAIWMLGANFDDVGWPACGEMDIMEQTGDNKDNVLGTFHWDGGSYGETTSIENASTEFHTYAMEWTEESIKIFVDDTKYVEMTNDAALPFDENFFLILNIAMGGTLGGTIDPNFTEDVMEIDYVRVYQ